MKYPKPNLFKPTEKELKQVAEKVAENFTDKVKVAGVRGKKKVPNNF
jgi:hypothetical protein